MWTLNGLWFLLALILSSKLHILLVYLVLVNKERRCREMDHTQSCFVAFCHHVFFAERGSVRRS